MEAALTRTDIADILRFYQSAGLDFALDEVSQDRLESAPIVASLEGFVAPVLGQAAVAPRPRPTVASASTAVPDEATAQRAQEDARAATSLDALHEALLAFDGCGLKFTARNLVFEDGNRNAKIMLIGEAPDKDEDQAGKPFVGQTGQMLDQMLKAIGLDRTNIYLANMIYWRPPGNRVPTPTETNICRPFIERQIELVNPDILMVVGPVCVKSFMPHMTNIFKSRGVWSEWTLTSGRTIPLLPMLHPTYLMRQPAHKNLAWRDLLSLKAKVRELGLT